MEVEESNNEIEENEKPKVKKWQIITVISIISLLLASAFFSGGVLLGHKLYRIEEYNNDWIIKNSLHYVGVSYVNGSHHSTIHYNRLWEDQPELLYLQFWDNDPKDRNNPECFDLYVGNNTYAYQIVNISLAFSKYLTTRNYLKFEFYSYEFNPVTSIGINPQFIYGDKNVKNGTLTLESSNVTFIEYRIMY